MLHRRHPLRQAEIAEFSRCTHSYRTHTLTTGVHIYLSRRSYISAGFYAFHSGILCDRLPCTKKCHKKKFVSCHFRSRSISLRLFIRRSYRDRIKQHASYKTRTAVDTRRRRISPTTASHWSPFTIRRTACRRSILDYRTFMD